MSSDGRHELFIEIHDETVRRALEPETETETEADGRSESALVEDGVVVRTDSLRELRAALNGWRRLVSVAEETERVVR
ncbi:MAG: KEOPS complex subunit Pcc1 [Halobacteriales archaeon]|nr:KEOPS complex subunit Pcc1 [Halobacteriales archaeon]